MYIDVRSDYKKMEQGLAMGVYPIHSLLHRRTHASNFAPYGVHD